MKQLPFLPLLGGCMMLVLLSGCRNKPNTDILPVPATGEQAQIPENNEPEPVVVALPATGNLRYVLYDDGGVSGELIGCNDSIVPVTLSLPPYSSWAEVIDHLYSGLINAQGQTWTLQTAIPNTLVVDEVIVTGGVATVSLSGTLLIGGVCDNPRIQEQLTRIALQYPQITEVAIDINGEPLDEYLSLQ